MAGLITGASIISGELIVSLDSGEIIRVGYVQGPQGLQGPQGPMGSTGRPGQDGNTILNGAGSPRQDEGRDGDFWIDTVEWTIRLKASGRWGAPQPLIAPAKNRSGEFGADRRMNAGPGRFFPMGGVSSGVFTGGGGSAGLPITGHDKPLAAGFPLQVAADQDGNAMIVDIYAESAQGARLVEVAVMRDSAMNTGYSEVYEVRTGTVFPVLTFQAINDGGGNLGLVVQSDVNLVVLRGRVMYI